MAHHEHVHFGLSDWAPAAIVVLSGMIYLFMVLLLRAKKKKWNTLSAICFITGCGLLTVAVWPAMMHWGHADMRGHMVQHLLIAMYGPIFLVLGAPVTLAARTLPTRASRKVMAVFKSRLFQIFSHPAAALVLNIGGMYILYLTPLYNRSLASPLLHYLIHIHFLLAGYLFTWSIIGVDPAPRRPSLRIRLLFLFISIGAHAFLSKLIYAHTLPLNAPHTADQIRQGARLMYYWGDLSELILVVLLFLIWYRKGARAKSELSPLIA